MGVVDPNFACVGYTGGHGRAAFFCDKAQVMRLANSTAMNQGLADDLLGLYPGSFTAGKLCAGGIGQPVRHADFYSTIMSNGQPQAADPSAFV